MKSDFSRDSFNPTEQLLRVLMQQGRVVLDADLNEQAAILIYLLRQVTRDVIGHHGTPLAFRGGTSFQVQANGEINSGRYYVGGWIIEYDGEVFYNQQPFYPQPPEIEARRYLLYLDVWERHLNIIERPRNREVALGGPDTATRSQVVWQIKAISALDLDAGDPVQLLHDWRGLVGLASHLPEGMIDRLAPPVLRRERIIQGRLRADADQEARDDEPCTLPPDSIYRGVENQLYRVEIHHGGLAANAENLPELQDSLGVATFKWSRNNGSEVYPVVDAPALGGDSVTFEVAHLGRNDRDALQPGDWVEFMDDRIALHELPRPLFQVASIDRDYLQVVLANPHRHNIVASRAEWRPYLRRWHHTPDPDHSEGTKFVREAEWIDLEDGVRVQFVRSENQAEASVYFSGDYWLIPARVATDGYSIGDVLWPEDANGEPIAEPPRGVEHQYAPLLFAGEEENAAGELQLTGDDLRCVFASLCSLVER